MDSILSYTMICIIHIYTIYVYNCNMCDCPSVRATTPLSKRDLVSCNT